MKTIVINLYDPEVTKSRVPLENMLERLSKKYDIVALIIVTADGKFIVEKDTEDMLVRKTLDSADDYIKAMRKIARKLEKRLGKEVILAELWDYDRDTIAYLVQKQMDFLPSPPPILFP